MKKALIVLMVITCVFCLISCNGKSIIVSIHYDERSSSLPAIEEFFEDENTVYYFPTLRSDVITVTYLNGDSESLRSALNAGRVTVADLDRFHIAYCTMPKE